MRNPNRTQSHTESTQARGRSATQPCLSPRGPRADSTGAAARLLLVGVNLPSSPGLMNPQGHSKPGRRQGSRATFTGGRGSSRRSRSLHHSSPLTRGHLGAVSPSPRGLPYRPWCCRYRKVVFRLIDSGISSLGQGVEDYTSCFKIYLCYRLVFKSLSSGMLVFYELSYRPANPQRRSITHTNLSQTQHRRKRDRK